MENRTTVASKIPFSSFCKHCEKFQKAQKKKKLDALRNYITYFRGFAESLKTKEPDVDVSFYPVLRLLLPQAERERGAYGIKEPTLAKILIRVLCLPKEGADAKKLLNFKAPSNAGGAAQSGDFADIAFLVMKLRCPQEGTLSVEDVNTHLDNIAIKHAEHIPRGVDDELIAMIRSMTALEVKWLIRIILKDMKFNFGQNSILKLYHIDAPELFDVSNSLLKVCSTLHDPLDRLHKLEIELFSPFRPMLSKRLDIAEINKYVRSDTLFYLETKFDGERFQIHMKDACFKYFSRNGYDFTQEYGASAAEGLLTPKIVPLLKPGLKSFILDGEMMGWNKNKQCFGSKGMNFDVKKLTTDSVHQPCFCAFDITLLDDEILTDRPLAKRLSLLDNVFKEMEGVIMHSKRKEASTADEVISALNIAIDDREEGIVMKTPNSIYKPNNRNAGWFKIKPEYTAGVLSELDLLIIGGYYGQGKSKGRITSFLLGVAVTDDPGDAVPRMFHSVGRVGIGFTAAELEELARSLHLFWKKPPGSASSRRIRECPPGIAWTKERPDVWIEPKHSCIVQVKATELVRSSAFKTSYTLRFPRVEKVRHDKPWHGCMTLNEFNSLVKNWSSVEKLTTRHINSDDIDDNEPSGSGSPRKRARVQIVPVPASLQLDASKIPVISKRLSGKEFCVLTGTADLTKPQIEKKIIENSGTVVQNAGPNTHCILAGRVTVRVTNHINLATTSENINSHDVIHVSWLLRALEDNSDSETDLVYYRPAEVLGATENTRDELALLYDQYGDGYFEEVTIDMLKMAMEKVDSMDHAIIPMRREMQALDAELFEDGFSPYSPLRNVTAYILTSKSVSDNPELCSRSQEFEILKADLVFLGANVLDEPNGEVTHVIMGFDENHDVAKLELLRSQIPDLKIANPDWVQQCLDARRCIDI